MEDIPLLIDFFINKFNRIKGKAVSGVDNEVLETLMAHQFPGNIRELENILEHAFVLCSEGNIQLQHLPGNLSSPSYRTNECAIEKDLIKAAESKVITEALKRNRYNRKAAAAELGMHKSTLFRKINKLGIHLSKIDGRTNHRQNH
jgi:transcriptional regulator with PAS, ATPase and Fis domain